MIDISLVELKKRKEKKNYHYDSLSYISSINYKNQNRFMTNVKIDDAKITVNDITTNFSEGRYQLTDEYTIFFLYDILNDNISYDFIKTYGGKIHNQTSANISIVTSFSKDMVNNWTNVYSRKNIIYGFENNTSKVLELFDSLKVAYKVNNFPTLIIVKKDDDFNEKSLNIDVSNHSSKEIYDLFQKVINIINEHCEEDFSIIASKINGYNKNGENNINNICLSKYIYNLVKLKDKISDYGYTQVDLAEELNISVRTLTNKRINHSFTRAECILIGKKFSLDKDEINDLLNKNGLSELSENESKLLGIR